MLSTPLERRLHRGARAPRLRDAETSDGASRVRTTGSHRVALQKCAEHMSYCEVRRRIGILGCKELETLARWHRRAITVAVTAALFE